MVKLLLLIMLITQPIIANAEVEPFSIERSQVISITSKDSKREYQLYIKTPRSYLKNTTKKYPLIFLNDGSYAFPLVSSITRQMSGNGIIEEPIIVGISYDKKTTWQISRTRDYTPTHSPKEKQRHSDEARKQSGGAADYINFIELELLPFLRDKFRIDTHKEIYAGHSFAGLLGGYILKTKPHLFDHYILSDPSFWYHNESIFDIKGKTSSLKLDVLVFSQGQNIKSKKKICTFCMAENSKKFSEKLSKTLPKASIEYIELKGEIHETMFPASISRGLIRYLGKQKAS